MGVLTLALTGCASAEVDQVTAMRADAGEVVSTASATPSGPAPTPTAEPQLFGTPAVFSGVGAAIVHVEIPPADQAAGEAIDDTVWVHLRFWCTGGSTGYAVEPLDDQDLGARGVSCTGQPIDYRYPVRGDEAVRAATSLRIILGGDVSWNLETAVARG